MPKKSRRTKAKHRAKTATAVPRPPQQAKPVAAAHRAAIRVSSELKTSSYQYLGPELRHIGILAGSIIVILIVLSFIL